MHFIGHFKTITRHKILVAKGCFKLGLYYQGIMHDMSKYSPTEFLAGAKYYQGTASPNLPHGFITKVVIVIISNTGLITVLTKNIRDLWE